MEDSLRIKFLKGDDHVNHDKKVFELYRQGAIGPLQGSKLIALNNGCVVTPQMFMSNAKWLGYDPNGYPEIKRLGRKGHDNK